MGKIQPSWQIKQYCASGIHVQSRLQVALLSKIRGNLVNTPNPRSKQRGGHKFLPYPWDCAVKSYWEQETG